MIKNKDVALFGAFGWAEKATKDIAEMTTKFGGKPQEGALTWKFQVDDALLAKAFALGQSLGKKAIEKGHK